MRVRDILGLVAAFCVLVAAANGHTTTAHRKSAHFSAWVGAHQKVNDNVGYEPPRSPGFNVLTGS
jgi:hypothetical protein